MESEGEQRQIRGERSCVIPQELLSLQEGYEWSAWHGDVTSDELKGIILRAYNKFCWGAWGWIFQCSELQFPPFAEKTLQLGSQYFSLLVVKYSLLIKSYGGERERFRTPLICNEAFGFLILIKFLGLFFFFLHPTLQSLSGCFYVYFLSLIYLLLPLCIFSFLGLIQPEGFMMRVAQTGKFTAEQSF